MHLSDSHSPTNEMNLTGEGGEGVNPVLSTHQETLCPESGFDGAGPAARNESWPVRTTVGTLFVGGHVHPESKAVRLRASARAPA